MSENKHNKPRVFIADDDMMIRSLLRLILREDGYNVVGEAATGEGIVDDCKDTHPEVLLLDINMPGADGLQVLEKIRVAQPEVKVIMIQCRRHARARDGSAAERGRRIHRQALQRGQGTGRYFERAAQKREQMRASAGQRADPASR